MSLDIGVFMIYVGALRDKYFSFLHNKGIYDIEIDESSYYKGKIDAYNEIYSKLAEVRDKEMGW